ncbi:MAG: penicillin-binding protein 1C, partial [Bacteroidia bacterium]
IHLDASGQYRVTSECEAVDQMRHEPWFVLPPAMEFYYKTKNPQYSMLPPVRAGCGGVATSSSMEFMYPRNATQIYIPIELDGRPGRTVFEIAHRKARATINWHLDDQYLGSTNDIHHIALNPEPGKHTVTAVDESGETISVEVEIVSEKRQ